MSASLNWIAWCCGDRLAEGLALLGVLDAQLERALRDADATSGDVHAADFERVHHLDEALVEAGLFAAEDVLGRALVAVVDELGATRRPCSPSS